MKVKIDKEEYEQLLKNIERLKIEVDTIKMFSNDIGKRLNEYLDNFFKEKCRVMYFKQENGMIEAQIRQSVIEKLDELFGEE